jgi:hypothetical protein
MFQPARFSFFIAIVLLAMTLPAAASPHAPDLARLPMTFEENKGQGPGDAEFLSRGTGYTVLFGRERVRIYTGKATVTMRILAPSRLLRIEGTDQQQGKSNYFFGNDRSKWLAGVPNYLRVRYRGVYPGIDLVFYGNGTQLEYDWIVSPGADPLRIRTKFEGVRGMRVGAGGDLLLALKKDQLQWRRPDSYQGEGEGKVAVKAGFKITGRREVRFTIGNYDRNRVLVIDPILVYATYLGGSGTDYLFALAVDSEGNSYVTGGTGSPNFPIVSGAYQSAFKSSGMAGFITKINPQGTALVYSTFIGGTGDNNATQAIAVDSLGYAYVTGGTDSTDFPTVNPVQAHNAGATDIFLLKLSPNGGSLVYSTYLGGSGTEFAQGLAIDAATNVYLTGWTNSTTNFPTVNAIQPTFGGGSQDSFLTKINVAGSAIVYSTYLGGNNTDNGYGVAVDPLNQVYVDGYTYSTNFPTKNAFQSVYNGNNDAFVTAVNATGTAYLYSTYLGGDNQDRARAIYVDATSNAYVTGDTQSPSHYNGISFPVTSNAYQPHRAGCIQSNCGGSADAFLTKLNASGGVVYSTYFGGATGYDCSSTPTFGCGADKGLGITQDPAGNIFIGGTTNSTDFPLVTPTQLAQSGSYEAFIIKFNGNFNAAQKILFSTYFGGSGTDYAYNLARTQQGNIYVSGWANLSLDFPHSATPPLFAYGGGTYDGFVMELANADISVVPQGFQVQSQKSGASSHELRPEAVAGGNYSFSVGLQNSASSADADNGVMTVTASGPTTLGSCTSSEGSCSISGNVVTLNNLPTLAHGTTVFVTIDGQLTASATQGEQVTFQAYGLSDTNNPDPSNNTSTSSFTVQNSCALTVSSSTTSFSSTGGMGNFSVNSPCGFQWTTSNPVNWLLAPESGANGGPFSFNVLPNPTQAPRTATLSISGQPLVITQSPPSPMVLLYDPSSGDEYSALSNNNGAYAYTANIFTSGFDTLRTGDFNGDGKTDLVLYNSKTALAYIGSGNGNGTFAFQSLFWSPGYNFVATGDLNGDGKTDVALYNSSTGTMYTGISNGDGTFNYKYTLISIGFTFLRLADFTGDGKADLFVYNAATGAAFLGVGNGAGGFTFDPLSISPGYNLADVGDLNGDGKADIILYNGTNGNAATGISNGSGVFTFTPLVFSPGFTSVRLADYTGDGMADVTVYNMNSAVAYFGTGNGAGNFAFQSLFWSPGYNWVIPQDLNLNGNGKFDVILYNSVTGTEYTGIGNGAGGFTYTYSYWGPNKTLAQ